MKRYLQHLLGFGLLASLTSSLFASGYKIEMQTPSVLADGGDAAVIDDASTNWYNSAGLVYLPKQLALSGIEVYAPTTFSGSVVAPTILPVPVAPFTAVSQTSSSHPRAFLPSIHGSYPLNEHFSLGLSVVPAWGLKEDYGIDDFTRYNLVRVYTKTLDVAPSLAWRPTEHWSIGAGPDFHYFSVQSRLKSRTAPVTGLNDSLNRYIADNWGYGGHAGLMYRINDATRIGLNYRTKILMDMEGYSSFGFTGIGAYETNNFKLRIPLPPITTLSAYRDITSAWAMMGTISYEQWGIVKNYRAKNFQGPAGVVIPVIYQPQGMHNTMDFALGTHYKLTDKFLFRGAFRYLETPTNDDFRGITFPDGDKYGINVGCRYQFTKKVGVDFIYAHVITKKVSINDVNPATGATATGHSVTGVDLGGAQLVIDL